MLTLKYFDKLSESDNMTGLLNLSPYKTMLILCTLMLSCSKTPESPTNVTEPATLSSPEKSIVGIWYNPTASEDRGLQTAHTTSLEFRNNGRIKTIHYFDSFRNGARRFCKRECEGVYYYSNPRTIIAKYDSGYCLASSLDQIRIFEGSEAEDSVGLYIVGLVHGSIFNRYQKLPDLLAEAKSDSFNCDFYVKLENIKPSRLPASTNKKQK